MKITGLPAARCYQNSIALALADFPGAVARYFNRHGVYDKSAFGLMHELHMDALKKTWLPGMDNAVYGEDYFPLVEQVLADRKTYQQVITDPTLDVLMYPSTKIPNPPNDRGDSLATRGPLDAMLPETQLGANMLFAPVQRTPSISLFSGLDQAEMPLSMTFDGYSGQDRKLLDIAEVIEQVLSALAEPKAIS